MATSIALLRGRPSIQALPKCVHTLASSMHATQLSRCTLNRLYQQLFSTKCFHWHLLRPSVFTLASAKTHGEEPNSFHASTARRNRSVLSQSSSLCEATPKQDHQQNMVSKLVKLMSRNCRVDTLLAKQNGLLLLRGPHKCFLESRRQTSQRRMHHFSTRASYSTLEGAGLRNEYQSPLGALCRVQAFGTIADKETGDPLSPKSAEFRCYMDHLRKEHQSISETLQGGEPLSDSKQKELRGSMMELGPVLDKWAELISTEEEIVELQHLIEASAESSQDKEMQELAGAEKDELVAAMADISEELIDLLMPSEETDDNDVILEFSAGVGGQEAMLFAADMFDMYQRYASYRRWTFNVLEYFTTDFGGLRHASVSVSGDQAFRLLRQEAGVHRVQRVPRTESKGRVHTSTMAIAVLPQPKEIDLNLDPKDLRIETKKASGAGGQHVNTTDSAVRITHLPTGISAESQQERSQHKNRAIAMTMLQTRIYNVILEKQTSSERSLRRSQVGSSGRSEKIRTYNYQQDRVTDHRIGRSVHGVPEYLLGTELLDDMVTSSVEGEECQEVKERILEVYDKHKDSTR